MRRSRHLVLAAATFVLAPLPHAGRALASATIIVQNVDGAGEGFNDPTPFTPVGGNPATTLGEARLNAFEYAADIWAAQLNSSVTIIVQAKMDPLTCTSSSAVLGSAGATTVHRNFTNAPVADTWYCQALANSLAGVDLDPSHPDITATFNSNLNGSTSCLNGIEWYYGYDGNSGNNIDFVTVVLHEIGHGLGFQTYCDLSTGARLNGFNDTYMLKIDRALASPSSFSAMSDAQRVSASTSDPNLRWIGASVTAAVPLVPVIAGLNGNYARLHAPSTLVIGSSVSHWSSAITPNQSMEPSYTGPNHDTGLALNLMEDIGWSVVHPCSPEVTTFAQTDTASVAQTAASYQVAVQIRNTGGFTAHNVSATMSGGPGWLTFPDPGCNYPDLAAGASSFGLDSYTLGISGWPGGTFTVNLHIAWQDGCGTNYIKNVPVTLLPATRPIPPLEKVYVNRLEANIPNPFNPATIIRYEIAAAGAVKLDIFDVSGHRVRTLVNRSQSAGFYEARWDGRDDSGHAAVSGVYFYRLQTGSFTNTKRMVLLK